jgi:hypothetical protein
MEISMNTRPFPALLVAVLLGVAWGASGCYSPGDSQRYFRQAAAKDPALEPLHETALYTVYFDHALRRCVLHSAHTWGEHGGGGGGTGVGISAFRCDPIRIKARVDQLNLRIEDIRDPDAPRVRDQKRRPKPKRPAAEQPKAMGEQPADAEASAPPPTNP